MPAASPFTVTLPCGCFFQGRELIVSPACTEHGAEPDIFAVVWCDFIPLSLPQPDAETAIRYAQQMNARAVIAGRRITHLRAVKLAAGSDQIETLWRPDEVVHPNMTK